jgi:hypothetical protein
MQWLRTSKYKILLILLGFQNLWNSINLFIKNNYENVHLNVSYEFHSSMGWKKSRCGVLSGTTQGWSCPLICSTYFEISKL